jgi:hypothetical protein
MSESGLRLRECQDGRELSINQQSADEQHARFGRCANAEQFLVITGFHAQIRELFPGGNGPPYRARKVIQCDLELCAPHSFVRGHETLGEKIAAGVVNEQHDASVTIVLGDVVTQRIERLSDVPGSGEYG